MKMKSSKIRKIKNENTAASSIHHGPSINNLSFRWQRTTTILQYDNEMVCLDIKILVNA